MQHNISARAGSTWSRLALDTRTAYSRLFPQILDEFGWDRGITAGAFSFGFLVSAVVTPCVGCQATAQSERTRQPPARSQR
jgi:hypothetical protein